MLPTSPPAQRQYNHLHTQLRSISGVHLSRASTTRCAHRAQVSSQSARWKLWGIHDGERAGRRLLHRSPPFARTRRRQSGTATHPEAHQHAPTLTNAAKALWLRRVATVSGALQRTASAALRRSASDPPLQWRVRTPRRRLIRGADERRLLARALGPFAPFAHRVRCAARLADFLHH